MEAEDPPAALAVGDRWEALVGAALPAGSAVGILQADLAEEAVATSAVVAEDMAGTDNRQSY